MGYGTMCVCAYDAYWLHECIAILYNSSTCFCFPPCSSSTLCTLLAWARLPAYNASKSSPILQPRSAFYVSFNGTFNTLIYFLAFQLYRPEYYFGIHTRTTSITEQSMLWSKWNQSQHCHQWPVARPWQNRTRLVWWSVWRWARVTMTIAYQDILMNLCN